MGINILCPTGRRQKEERKGKAVAFKNITLKISLLPPKEGQQGRSQKKSCVFGESGMSAIRISFSPFGGGGGIAVVFFSLSLIFVFLPGGNFCVAQKVN